MSVEDLRPSIKNETVQTYLRDGKMLVLFPDIPTWVSVSEPLGAILLSLDGTRSLGEVITEIRNKYGEGASKGVENCFNKLNKIAFVGNNPKDTKTNMYGSV